MRNPPGSFRDNPVSRPYALVSARLSPNVAAS